MVRTGILGATGFTGEKLAEILLLHPEIELTYAASRTKKPVLYSDIFPRFYKKTRIKCEPLDIAKACASCDFLFLALPHTVSMQYVPGLVKKGKKLVDLSADYRLESSVYKTFYRIPHRDKKNLKKAVYGLPELFKDKIKEAQLVANPGCYSTSVILALYPLIAEGMLKGKIVVDSKSAVTGAGRKASLDSHYSHINNNFWAYKPFVHQHAPEISQILKLKSKAVPEICFLPQVAEFETGIYSTVHISFKKKSAGNKEKLAGVFRKYYNNAPFIRIRSQIPKLKDVAGTNFCDIGFGVDAQGANGVVISAIDNLIKGAAGQAVQNMNLMLGWPEASGLL